eukprot:2902004-Amphidinium_carterae.2
MIISWVKDFVIWVAIKINNGFMPKKLLTFIISKLVDYFWRASVIIKICIMSMVISKLVFINLPPQHHDHTSLQHLSSVDCRAAAAPVLVWPSDCGQSQTASSWDQELLRPSPLITVSAHSREQQKL